MQHEIVTLTLNPTIDGAAEAEALAPYVKVRTSNERYSAGGGGINVARTIQSLGGRATAIYLAGGPTGALLHELLVSAELPARCIGIAGGTRIAHTVLERSTGAEYRFVPEGPTVSPLEWAECVAMLERERWDYLVLSGSHAPGVPEDAYGMLARLAKQRGARLILDSSGTGLRSGLDAGVYLVKPSIGELQEYVGHQLADEPSQIAACRDLIAKHRASVVALTLGSEGALLVTETDHWRLRPPPIHAMSAVGAGDSFVGAITLLLARGHAVEEAFAYGVAAGTAAVLSCGNEPPEAEQVGKLFDQLTAGRTFAPPSPELSITG